MTPTVESKRESSADSKELQWLALSRVPGLGYRTITSLIKTGTDIGKLFKAPSGALIRDFGLSEKKPDFLKLPGVSLRVSSCSQKRADHEGGPANEPEEFKHA